MTNFVLSLDDIGAGIKFLLIVLGAAVTIVGVVVRWKMNQLSKGQTTLFDMVNADREKIRALELAMLSMSHGDTQVFSAIVGKVKKEGADKK